MKLRVNKILKFARMLPDNRIDRKKLHLAEDIVFITVLAVICGANSWEDIALFRRSKRKFLKTILSLKNGIPCPDTFNRFFANLDSGVFESCFIEWTNELFGLYKGIVAIDAKTIRGSKKK